MLVMALGKVPSAGYTCPNYFFPKSYTATIPFYEGEQVRIDLF